MSDQLNDDPCFDRVMEAIVNAQRPLQAQLAATHAAIRALRDKFERMESYAPGTPERRAWVNASKSCAMDLDKLLARLLGDPAP